MKELEELVTKAEERWFESIFEYISQQFKSNPLPSHDQYHHLRVWENAKFLIAQFPDKKVSPDYTFIESLMIASLFHDLGMIKTREKDHGKESKEICQEFFHEKEKPAKFLEILEAIERHDDKNYSGFGPLISQGKANLITSLNIADDLDSFGNIGVYRFTEIYLLRGIPFEDLGLKIIANLSGRFRHFMSNCTGMDKMITTYLPKYHIIENFFRYYNLQIRKIESGEGDQASGPIAVTKQIYRHTLMNANDIREVCDSILGAGHDEYIIKFFQALKEEISKSSA